MNEKKGRAIALLPIGVFLVLYLGLGIIFEYVMKIPHHRGISCSYLGRMYPEPGIGI